MTGNSLGRVCGKTAVLGHKPRGREDEKKAGFFFWIEFLCDFFFWTCLFEEKNDSVRNFNERQKTKKNCQSYTIGVCTAAVDA